MSTNLLSMETGNLSLPLKPIKPWDNNYNYYNLYHDVESECIQPFSSGFVITTIRKEKDIVTTVRSEEDMIETQKEFLSSTRIEEELPKSTRIEEFQSPADTALGP